MGSLHRAVVPAALVALLLCAVGGRAESPQVQTPAPTPNAPGGEQFAGAWDYNAQESVNAATGRPEQNPRGAAQRPAPGAAGPRVGGGPGGPPGVGGLGGPAGVGAGGRDGGYTSGVGLGPSPMALAEMRTLVRDLYEVPEMLTIVVTPEAVTFTDDLDRERTYPTDGKKHKYQLSGSQFEARVYWNGNQLKREIEGGYDFKMTETYFLSDHARRLFVIIRLGDQKRKPPPRAVGANRVYDRVGPSADRRRDARGPQ